jgi:hypothetical protein
MGVRCFKAHLAHSELAVGGVKVVSDCLVGHSAYAVVVVKAAVAEDFGVDAPVVKSIAFSDECVVLWAGGDEESSEPLWKRTRRIVGSGEDGTGVEFCNIGVIPWSIIL